MAKPVKAVPDGQHTLTAHLVVKKSTDAIEFYKKAFGAEEIRRITMPGHDGIMHAELKLGDSRIYLCDEFPEMQCKGPLTLGGTPVTIHMFVENVDASFAKAVAAGAQVRMPLADMFWGDRYGVLADPFGHAWSMASHKEDLTPEEIGKRAQEAFANGGCGQ